MGYLNSVLMGDGPLEECEMQALRDWRDAIEAECELFGEMDADKDRLRLINKRLGEAPTNG